MNSVEFITHIKVPQVSTFAPSIIQRDLWIPRGLHMTGLPTLKYRIDLGARTQGFGQRIKTTNQ